MIPRAMLREIHRAIDAMEARVREMEDSAADEVPAGQAIPYANQNAGTVAGPNLSPKARGFVAPPPPSPPVEAPQLREIRGGERLQIKAQKLDANHLLAHRIFAHNGADQRARPYDILRTEVVQSMNRHQWKIVGVTSPTPGCGTTVTAINLAFSVARQPDNAALLVDMDLLKPQIANSLGIKPVQGGLLDVLEGRSAPQNVVQRAQVASERLDVMLTAPSRRSSELMNSRALTSVLRQLRTSYPDYIIILDLPPMLTSDDVLAILPHLDCVLLVVAAGASKTPDLEECNKHLRSSPIVRVVVNKSYQAPKYR